MIMDRVSIIGKLRVISELWFMDARGEWRIYNRCIVDRRDDNAREPYTAFAIKSETVSRIGGSAAAFKMQIEV